MSNALIQASTDITKNAAIGKQLAQLDKMSAGINISPNYFEFADKGQKTRGVYLGFVQMEIIDKENGEVKTLGCVAWMDAEQNVWQNGGKALVSAFGGSGLELYTPVEIEYQGQKKVDSGYMKMYAVRPLANAQ